MHSMPRDSGNRGLANHGLSDTRNVLRTSVLAVFVSLLVPSFASASGVVVRHHNNASQWRVTGISTECYEDTDCDFTGQVVVRYHGRVVMSSGFGCELGDETYETDSSFY